MLGVERLSDDVFLLDLLEEFIIGLKLNILESLLAKFLL